MRSSSLCRVVPRTPGNYVHHWIVNTPVCPQKWTLPFLSSNNLRQAPLVGASSPVLQPARVPRLMMSAEGVDVGGRRGEGQTETREELCYFRG